MSAAKSVTDKITFYSHVTLMQVNFWSSGDIKVCDLHFKATGFGMVMLRLNSQGKAIVEWS